MSKFIFFNFFKYNSAYTIFFLILKLKTKHSFENFLKFLSNVENKYAFIFNFLSTML